MQGVTYWTDGDLQLDLAEHKYFAVRTSAARDIVMTSPAPTEQ